MKHATPETKPPRLAVQLDEPLHAELVRRAAEQSIAERRPVAVSVVVRDLLRTGLTHSAPLGLALEGTVHA